MHCTSKRQKILSTNLLKKRRRCTQIKPDRAYIGPIKTDEIKVTLKNDTN